MLRNSTEKYKKIYANIPNKDSKTTNAISTPTKTQPHFRTDNSVNSLSHVRYASTRKLQTYNFFNERHNFIYRYKGETQQDYAKLGKTLKKCSYTCKKTEQQKIYRTCADNFFQQQSAVTQIREVARDSEDFIQNLPKNTLFFCTHCFQFVFEIEKKRHYPDCKDAFSLNNRQTKEFYSLAIAKLQKIVQLSKYSVTKTQEIQKMYSTIQSGQLQVIDLVKYPKTYEFLRLEQIEMAFTYTYCTLLKGIKYRHQSSLFTCF